MRFSIQILVLTCLLGLFSACDYIEGPKVDETAFPSSGNKVLLEDFTGHQCGSCPRAHEKAAELKEIFGENLIIVGVHVGGFADVDVADGYLNDFKTPMGNDLDAYYAPYNEGLPVGLVNRRAFNGKPLIKHPNWGTAISQILAEDPKLSIDIQTAYNSTSREVSIQTDMEYFSAGTPDHQLVVIITEDSLESKQADYSLPAPSYISSYKQLHVLRASVTNGTWGEQIKPAQIFVGERLTKTHTFVLNPDWVAEKCEVVAYVIDNTTKEVLQAQIAHVVH
jgi:thiol-disulfide isomerase/thioredoxin